MWNIFYHEFSLPAPTLQAGAFPSFHRLSSVVNRQVPIFHFSAALSPTPPFTHSSSLPRARAKISRTTSLFASA
jgi:hypothetical protein